jgi:hydrogenase-4 component F
MTAFLLTILTPILGVLVLTGIRRPKVGIVINLCFSIITFVSSLFLAVLFWQRQETLFFSNKQFFVDAFSLLLVILTTFVGMTTAWFSSSYMLQNLLERRITTKRLQLYHILYQMFIFTMLLALFANNIGILWVAMEGATLATVLLVSLYRTKEAVEAAWKYFILCVVGIALALFGTILIYFTAQSIPEGGNAILWSDLCLYAKSLNPTIVTLAFVFLFVGYGTKIGLVPLHNWLPDAHSESPGPMSTLLSGLLLNVALYALLRFKIIADLVLHNGLTGNLLMFFGLFSFLFASVALHKQHNIKRMFSYSSIEHMGLITFAFGLGGQVATFAALLYMISHSLIKSAIFSTVGNIIHLMHTQKMEKIRCLLQINPVLGWLLLLLTLAVAGFPPFSLFTGELLVFIATVKLYPVLSALIVLGSIVAFAALLRHLQPMIYGKMDKEMELTITKKKFSTTPAVLHLLIVLGLGFYIPQAVVQLLQQAAMKF